MGFLKKLVKGAGKFFKKAGDAIGSGVKNVAGFGAKLIGTAVSASPAGGLTAKLFEGSYAAGGVAPSPDLWQQAQNAALGAISSATAKNSPKSAAQNAAFSGTMPDILNKALNTGKTISGWAIAGIVTGVLLLIGLVVVIFKKR